MGNIYYKSKCVLVKQNSKSYMLVFRINHWLQFLTIFKKENQFIAFPL